MAETLDGEWLRMAPIRIGPVPARLPAPDMFVLVEDGGKPLKRIDAYEPDQAMNVRTIAAIWGEWIVVGYCNLLFLVPIRDGQPVAIDLGVGGFDYISDFRIGTGFLLVATGEGILRIERDGSTAWRNFRLGLDGVRIESVNGRVVRGRGDWDPPDGWRDFAIDILTGEPVT